VKRTNYEDHHYEISSMILVLPLYLVQIFSSAPYSDILVSSVYVHSLM